MKKENNQSLLSLILIKRLERSRRLSAKKQKAEHLALFAKSSSSNRTSSGFFGKKKLKKNKSKSKLRPTNISYHICSEKEYQTPKCPKKRKNKTEQTKFSSSVYIAVKLSRNWKVRKMLIVICDGQKIEQVDRASIIDGILLDYVVTSHIVIR